MDESWPAPPTQYPILRYLAILRAARDFGLGRIDLERIVRRFDPLSVEPDELAGALTEALLRGSAPPV